VTARWVVDEVAPQRDLNLIWQPISLMFKNEPEPGSDYHTGTMVGHRMLRVMEAVRAEHGDAAVFDWYWQCGTRLHHDRQRDADLADLLDQVGLDPTLADAADDEAWDDEIRRRMDAGLELVGDDVGTPIIAFRDAEGTKRGIFGPVITRVPGTEQSLRMWDALQTFTTMDGFWEIKRTRTERPDFGSRPDV
jgi:hypothetical protein